MNAVIITIIGFALAGGYLIGRWQEMRLWNRRIERAEEQYAKENAG